MINNSEYTRIPYGLILLSFKESLRKELYIYALLQIAQYDCSNLNLQEFVKFVKTHSLIRDSRTIKRKVEELIKLGWVKIKNENLYPLDFHKIRDLIDDKEEIAFYFYLSYSKKSFDGFLLSSIIKVVNIKQEASDSYNENEDSYLGVSVRRLSEISGLVRSAIHKIKCDAIRDGFLKVRHVFSSYKGRSPMKFSNLNIPDTFIEKQNFGFRIGDKIIHCDECKTSLKSCKLDPVIEKKPKSDKLPLEDFQIAKFEDFNCKNENRYDSFF